MNRELPPELVPVSLPAIETRRQRLLDKGFVPSLGIAMVGPEYERLARRVANLLPSVDGAVVFDSLRTLLGPPLNQAASFAAAWRLAGNMRTLEAGRPASMWCGQIGDEWVPFEILRCDLARTRWDDIVNEFSICILAGSPCGIKTAVRWSRNVCGMLSQRLGFARRTAYGYRHPADLVGLRAYGKVLAEKSRSAPTIRDVECPAAIATWNRRSVLGLRCRVTAQCPRGFSHACGQCAVGYAECPAGTHWRTYVVGQCPKCGNPEATMDPERPATCIECARREATHKEE